MADGMTVLIGAAELLPALRARLDSGGEILAFRDLDSLDALEAIVARRPALVALERLFASTSRGTALLDRIKQDPALAAVEVRVVAHDSSHARVLAGVSPAPADVALDQRGTRRVPRVAVEPGLEALIDGNPVSLVDVSPMGAQVLSPGVLRPNQRVRLVLPPSVSGLRMSATIAWAVFEIPASRPAHYRAGLQFDGTPAQALAAFCSRHAHR